MKHHTHTQLVLIAWIVGLALLAGCGDARIEVTLDKPDPEQLLRFWFGSYLGPEGGDPVAAGILSVQGGRFRVDPDALDKWFPGGGDELRRRSRDGHVDSDGLADFLQATYYDARALPRTLAEFSAYQSWFRHDVHGPVTSARRHIYIAEDAVREALSGYADNGNRLIYSAGTAIVAEHHIGGDHIETTAMLRREDGFWDFVTYDADGNLATRTLALPRSIESPTQCVGCHFGSKLFEPERSFPEAAPQGPDGQRMIHSMGNSRVVRFFDEHRKRSDMVLGLHATLYVSELLKRPVSDDDHRLLEQLGL